MQKLLVLLVVSRIKKKNNSSSAGNKKVLFVLIAAMLLTAVLIVCILAINNKENLKYGTQNNTEGTIIYKEGLTFAPTKEDKSNENADSQTEQNKNENGNNIDTPAVSIENTQGNVLDNPSGWTKAQIISKAADAVNKTKAYTGNLTVAHSEGFTADVTECTGGEIVKSVVNLMIGWVVKPVDETLVYQNGKAVNSEGETVPIILPKRNGFSLNESGVESASVQRMGNEYVIKIKLVEESVGMYDVPTHNAGSVGYLDVASFDISFMDIDAADIVYKGSSIELRINAEGFVTYANYKIPLHIDGAAHKGSISGSAVFEGEQTEEWRLDW